VILASQEGTPNFSGVEEACAYPQADLKIFGKPTTRPYRRMAVALAYDRTGEESMDQLRARAAEIASKVKVH
jgi:phosphoribosylglycinamide formyltransferase 2